MTRYMQAALLVAKWLMAPIAAVLAGSAAVWMMVNRIIPPWALPLIVVFAVILFAVRVMFDLALMKVDERRRWEKRDEP